jgi:hypothetical protein
MSRVAFTTGGLAALLAIAPALAQTSQPAPGASEDDAIVVVGQREAVSRVIQERFSESRSQLARFEQKVCPMVAGMPVDWTAKLTQMIRENIVALGGKVGEPGCTVNATVIFSDQPHEFIQAFAKKQPAYFAMSPRQLDQFTAASRPVVSWHVTEIYSRDGQEMGGAREASQKQTLSVGGTSVTTTNDSPMSAKVNRQSAATRLYSNIREDMLVGFVVIDRQQTPGRTLRQLADLTTMHLLLDVKQDAGTKDPNSILSLFEPRAAGLSPPLSMSRLDRGIIQGFYGLNDNNRSAAQQYSQIAAAIQRGAGAKRE